MCNKYASKEKHCLYFVIKDWWIELPNVKFWHYFDQNTVLYGKEMTRKSICTLNRRMMRKCKYYSNKEHWLLLLPVFRNSGWTIHCWPTHPKSLWWLQLKCCQIKSVKIDIIFIDKILCCHSNFSIIDAACEAVRKQWYAFWGYTDDFVRWLFPTERVPYSYGNNGEYKTVYTLQ